MNTTTIFTTTRDQIALDIYIRLVGDPRRDWSTTTKQDARNCYAFADTFLAEMKRQQEALTPAPTTTDTVTPAPTITDTVPPVVGHWFLTRSRTVAWVTSKSRISGDYNAKIVGKDSYFLVYPDGHADDPANDLVRQLPS